MLRREPVGDLLSGCIQQRAQDGHASRPGRNRRHGPETSRAAAEVENGRFRLIVPVMGKGCHGFGEPAVPESEALLSQLPGGCFKGEPVLVSDTGRIHVFDQEWDAEFPCIGFRELGIGICRAFSDPVVDMAGDGTASRQFCQKRQ